MIPNRPILYLTLPSLALILGFVWLRRKKGVDCDTGGDKQSKHTKKANNSSVELADSYNKKATDQTTALYLNHSQSLPITTQNNQSTLNSSIDSDKSGSSSSNSSLDNKLGKSAPIDIAPNPRSPPKRLTEEQIDSEILKLKLQESDYKNLRSIEELEDFEAGSTPADSPLYRKKFSFAPKQPKIEPVIVKASMAAKISPENSFAESKYTKVEENDDEQRDSANQSPIGDDTEAVKLADTVAKSSELNVDDQQSTPTRNPPIASPPLSLCSLHSADSGKGSSPPHSVGAPSVCYDFLIPHSLIGHLIGRKGQFVNHIKAKTGANVIVKRHPQSKKAKVCTIEGVQTEIDAALKMIRTKLPERKYPFFSVDRVTLTSDNTVVPSFDPAVMHVSSC